MPSVCEADFIMDLLYIYMCIYIYTYTHTYIFIYLYLYIHIYFPTFAYFFPFKTMFSILSYPHSTISSVFNTTQNASTTILTSLILSVIKWCNSCLSFMTEQHGHVLYCIVCVLVILYLWMVSSIMAENQWILYLQWQYRSAYFGSVSSLLTKVTYSLRVVFFFFFPVMV